MLFLNSGSHSFNAMKNIFTKFRLKLYKVFQFWRYEKNLSPFIPN